MSDNRSEESNGLFYEIIQKISVLSAGSVVKTNSDMRTIKFIIQKEFIQIFRNRAMLPILFVMPIMQLLILSNVATFDVKNVRLHLTDKDQTSTSRALADKFTRSGYFILIDQDYSGTHYEDPLRRNEANMVMQIPRGFEVDLETSGISQVQFIINAEDGSAAGIINSYAMMIVNAFISEINKTKGITGLSNTIDIHTSFWFNPELDYKTYMIPGILAILVTMIGVFLSGMNIVREKEIGTIEQLNVSPIRKYQFIIGKLLPFWIIGLFELAFGLFIAKLVFDIPVAGSLTLVFAMAAVFLLAVLGIGLFISTITETQQQAMFIAWFFMVIFILMGGLFTPIESMPQWAQKISLFNPVAHFMKILRAVLIKGSGFYDVIPQAGALMAFAVTSLSLAVMRYRKVSE